MIVRRYSGKTADEALDVARRDLGPDVVVLLTKRLAGDPLGERVEVVVAVDAQSVRRREESGAFLRRGPQIVGVGAPSAPIQADAVAPRSEEERPSSDEPRPDSSSVDRLQARRARHAYGTPPPHYRIPLAQLLRERLEEQGVEEEVIHLFVREFGTTEPNVEDELTAAREILRRGLAKSLPIVGEMRPTKETRVLAFVGPTGVGKTTTIAKLAARTYLTEKRPVRLVTVDTYRIAGAEQLRTYGRILGVPCEVAMTPAALSEIVERARPGELVFLDTPGRSPTNRQQLIELRNLLDAVPRDETYLLVSGTTRSIDLWEIARGFYPLAPNRLIFTKLDEAANYGNIVNFTYHQRLPLSYFTTGQTVPDDIETASPDRLASLLLRTRRLFYC